MHKENGKKWRQIAGKNKRWDRLGRDKHSEGIWCGWSRRDAVHASNFLSVRIGDATAMVLKDNYSLSMEATYTTDMKKNHNARNTFKWEKWVKEKKPHTHTQKLKAEVSPHFSHLLWQLPPPSPNPKLHTWDLFEKQLISNINPEAQCRPGILVKDKNSHLSNFKPPSCVHMGALKKLRRNLSVIRHS